MRGSVGENTPDTEEHKRKIMKTLAGNTQSPYAMALRLVNSLLFAAVLTAITMAPVHAQVQSGESISSDEATGLDMKLYADVLFTYVNDEGMVDYRGLQSNRASLDRFVALMARLDPKVYEAWNEKQKIAFWINAYNSLTLRLIIDHYPIQSGGFLSGLRFPKNSIRQIPGVWDKIKHTVIGRQMTLDAIEHEVLRKQFDEPRIHMALVCAAMGCPSLRNEPYVGNRLDALLDDQSRKSLRNPVKFRIDRGSNTVHLSSIFEWFGGDFSKKYQTKEFQQADASVRPVLEFISRNVSDQDAQYLKKREYRTEYLDYDWILNEQH